MSIRKLIADADLEKLQHKSFSYFFGAHTYERVDAKGTFHTEWEKE
jgi:6-phosphogluconate dehydrogenase